MLPKVLALALCLLIPAAAMADFRYEETARVTGGSLLRMMKVAGVFSKQARQVNEPMTSTVYVKGNRMARVSAASTEIIDLDKETITSVDHANRTFTVVTFQQMKEQMEKAAREAKQKSNDKGEAAPEAQFKASVRTLNDTKQVAGLTAKHAILTMQLEAKDKESGQTGGFGITSDMWLAPEVPGYAEVRAFNERFARKMGAVFSGALGPAMAAMQPGMAKGMGEMAKEMAKLQGVPVMQVTRMGASPEGKPLPAASEMALPTEPAVETPNAGEVAEDAGRSAVASKVGGALGGMLGGFGRKKKKEEPKPEPKAQEAQSHPAAGVLVEMETQMSGFSSNAVEESRFAVPAGFRQTSAK